MPFRKHVIASSAMLLLASCVTTTGTGVTDMLVSRAGMCRDWRAISWSVDDTDQTILEVKQNNAAREERCT